MVAKSQQTSVKYAIHLKYLLQGQRRGWKPDAAARESLFGHRCGPMLLSAQGNLYFIKTKIHTLIVLCSGMSAIRHGLICDDDKAGDIVVIATNTFTVKHAKANI